MQFPHTIRPHAVLSAALLSLPLLAVSASAQVLQPVTANVSAAFSNPAGAVRTRLLDSSGPGMTDYAASARSTEAVPRVASMTAVAAGTRTSAAGVLTLDAAGSPSWTFQATAWLDHYGQQYFFASTVPLATAPGGGPYAQSFTRSVSIVDVNFGAAVSGGTIIISSADRSVTYGQVSGVPAGSTRSELVVPGGVPLLIEAALETGSGGETGSVRRVVRRITTWTGAGGVPDNTVQPVSLNLAEAVTLGAFTGTFDIAGAEELPVASGGNSFLPGWSRISASYFSATLPNYGGWRRLAVLNGGSATGTFTLGNLTSSASIAANDPGSSYGVQAEALLRRTLPSGGKGVQTVRTRLLLAGEVPAVPGGGSASLGSSFTINPAVVRGTLQLRGPFPVPGQPAMLSGIVTAADTDSNNDGLPEGLDALEGGLWSYRSGIFSNTVIDNNSGYGGTGWQIMERTWSAPNANCEYDIALANPNNETRDWTHPGLSLVMQNSSALENEYFNTQWYAQKRGAAPVNAAPGSVTTRNDSVSTGEVTIIVRSAAGSGVNIWQPRLLWNESGLTGDAANTWEVSGMVAYGWPSTSAGGTGRASLRTLLPAGTYTVRPTVLSANGASTLAPFTITVPARGRLTVDNGLVVAASIPPCLGAGGLAVNGTVSSGGANVTSITYSIDGGAAQNASFAPGPNPAFTIVLPAGLAGGAHSVTITVTTADGRTATSTQQFERDVTPPVIEPLADIVINDAPIGGQIVNYPLPVVTENCDTIYLSCNPPGGNVFPLGTTTVTCHAWDAADNNTFRTFTITLNPACPPPGRSHSYAGNADSNFTHPDKACYHAAVAMSIDAWVKREDNTRCETIVSQNYLSSFWFGFCPKLRFYRSGGFFADATVEVPHNQWTHVAVSYDGTTARFYINGQPAGESALSNAGTGSAGPVTIGGDYTGGGEASYTFKGSLDAIRIYSGALTQAGIQAVIFSEHDYPRLADWRDGGRRDFLLGATGAPGIPGGPAAPLAQVEGILPRFLLVPRTSNTVSVDGAANTASEYAGAEKMVIRYGSGPAIGDAIAHLVYRDEPGDRALYVGITGLRDVVAPWTRDQSFVSLYFSNDRPAFAEPYIATARDFRWSRRLDGTNNPGPTPVGFERGTGIGNFTAPAPGDPLFSAPSPFGIIGGGGTTMEFRFDQSILGGDWTGEKALGLFHHWVSGIGQDYAGVSGMIFDDASTWAALNFNGQLPVLRHSRTGDTLTLWWRNPGCDHYLESSTTMAAGSWVPRSDVEFIPAGTFEQLYRTASFDMNLTPRQFFRLKRP